MSGSSWGRKMLTDTVIIIHNGTMAVNVFSFLRGTAVGHIFPIQGKTGIAVYMVEGYYSQYKVGTF